MIGVWNTIHGTIYFEKILHSKTTFLAIEKAPCVQKETSVTLPIFSSCDSPPEVRLPEKPVGHHMLSEKLVCFTQVWARWQM